MRTATRYSFVTLARFVTLSAQARTIDVRIDIDS
jgi:hypothetical protein